MYIIRNNEKIKLTKNELFQAYKQQKYIFLRDFIGEFVWETYGKELDDEQLYILTTETLETLSTYENNDDETALIETIKYLNETEVLKI